MQPTTTTKILVDDDEGVCFSFFLSFFPLSIFSTISYRHSITHTPSFKHHSVGQRCRHILLAIFPSYLLYTLRVLLIPFFSQSTASHRVEKRKKKKCFQLSAFTALPACGFLFPSSSLFFFLYIDGFAQLESPSVCESLRTLISVAS